MMHAIRFTIVTDNIELALAHLLGCARTNVPPFIQALDDFEQILAIPDGMKCRGQWYSPRGQSPAEHAWRERRHKGGIAFISSEDEDRILDWLKRRRERSAEAPSSSELVVPLARSEPEISNIVLTQRWT